MNIISGAGDGNRTHVVSLEGWSSTIELHPHKMVTRRRFELLTLWLKVRCSTDWASESWYKSGWASWIRTSEMTESKSVALPLGYSPRMVGRDGFEPSNQKELSYSQPRLATSLPPQYMVPTIGIEPTTYWLQVSCSTNWAKSANKQMVGANGLEPLTLCL